MKKIISLLFFALITYSCQTIGEYNLNGNKYSQSGRSYLKLKKDSTFIYSWYNHIAGNHKVYGNWIEDGNKVLLQESDYKYRNNQINTLDSKSNNYIRVLNSNGRPIPAVILKVNNDTLNADFDGYCYYNKTVNYIKVSDPDTNLILGEFNLENSNLSSYEILIDYLTIVKSSCNNCPFTLLRKRNKLFPLNDNGEIDKNYFYRK